jgi:hypothetical protein
MYLVWKCSQTDERTGLHWTPLPMYSIMLSTSMYLVRQCSQTEERTGLHWTPLTPCSQ